MAKKGDDSGNFLLYHDSSHTADMQPKVVTDDNSVDISFESGSFRDMEIVSSWPMGTSDLQIFMQTRCTMVVKGSIQIQEASLET